MPDARVDAELVSVVMPAYNGEACIGDAIESVLGQSYPRLEVVVVDDGSSDGTWDVLQRFGDRIRAIRQPNGGLAAARNAGLRAARGDLIALMDHDDVCEPQRLAWQVHCLRQQPDTVLCSSDFSAFDSRGPISGSYCSTYYSRCSDTNGGVRARYPRESRLQLDGETARVFHGPVYDEVALGNFVHPPTALFRRGLLDRAGEFDAAADTMCDWDWLARAAGVGDFAHIDRPLLRYRRSDTQISSAAGQARGALAALAVLRHLQQRDPALALRQAPGQRRLRANLTLDAAYALAERERLRSLSLLGRGLLLHGHGAPWPFVARTLARIALPAALRAGLKKALRPNASV